MTARWCPSCRRAWPAGTVGCRECFVALVDLEELAATVRCSHCGREWPARMHACPSCLAELRPDPERAAELLAVTLAQGFYPSRPAGAVPFAGGPACTLLRTRAHASMIFVGDDGFLEAHVEGYDHRAAAPLWCRDLDGAELFHVDRYQAAEDAVAVSDPDGASLATFLRRPGGMSPVIDVRDETSAPVAALRASSGGPGGYVLVETGGSTLARVVSADVELDGWLDDEWSVRPAVAAGRLPLRPLAVVALALAAKMLLGRVTPSRAPRVSLGEVDLLEDGE